MKRFGGLALVIVFLATQAPGSALAAGGPPVGREGPALLGKTYADALSILRGENSCSRFFGGPAAAEEALGRLVAQLRAGAVGDSAVGIRMSGAFTFYSRPNRGFSYRLFEEARINTAGPFYRAKSFPSEPRIPNVGSFRPNTRKARALMLLHELGHLIVGADGKWLLADDAHDREQNARNTAAVESRCRGQILSL